MIRILFSFIFLVSLLHAGFVDDIKLYRAQNAYKNQDFNRSYELYNSFVSKSDEILYNLANTLYKQHKYDRAITTYKQIQSGDLSFRAYHNIANSYVKMQRLEKAISYYKAALLIKPDDETKANLLYAQNLQLIREKEARKKQAKSQGLSPKSSSMDGNLSNSSDQTELLSTWNKKVKIIKKRDNNAKLSHNARGTKIQTGQASDINRSISYKADHSLSTREQKKWDLKLSNVELKTLLIPLDFKGDYDENIQW